MSQNNSFRSFTNLMEAKQKVNFKVPEFMYYIHGPRGQVTSVHLPELVASAIDTMRGEGDKADDFVTLQLRAISPFDVPEMAKKAAQWSYDRMKEIAKNEGGDVAREAAEQLEDPDFLRNHTQTMIQILVAALAPTKRMSAGELVSRLDAGKNVTLDDVKGNAKVTTLKDPEVMPSDAIKAVEDVLGKFTKFEG
jgi:hypothetical protein